MSILRKRSTENNEVYTFEFKGDHSFKEIVRWIYDLLNSSIVVTDAITLWDMTRNSDEGNESIDFSYPVEEKLILKEMLERDVDRLIISGELKRKPITINLNLKNYEVNLALNKDCLIDEHELEKFLKLPK